MPAPSRPLPQIVLSPVQAMPMRLAEQATVYLSMSSTVPLNQQQAVLHQIPLLPLQLHQSQSPPILLPRDSQQAGHTTAVMSMAQMDASYKTNLQIAKSTLSRFAFLPVQQQATPSQEQNTVSNVNSSLHS
jgi:hypothetical protein